MWHGVDTENVRQSAPFPHDLEVRDGCVACDEVRESVDPAVLLVGPAARLRDSVATATAAFSRPVVGATKTDQDSLWASPLGQALSCQSWWQWLTF